MPSKRVGTPTKCILCGIRARELPDRNSGSRTKKVCRECQASRLLGDLRHIVNLGTKKAVNRG